MSEETPGHKLLLNLVQRSTVQRRVGVVCQPFISNAETRQGRRNNVTIMGLSCHRVGIKKVVVKSRHNNDGYTTMLLPRLQLKLKSLRAINCFIECRKSFDAINN